MIIEYAGEVIRGSLTDMREKYYESKVQSMFCEASHISPLKCQLKQ